MTMEIRIPQNQEEIEAAVELSCKYFPLSYSEAMALKTAMREYLPGDFTKDNFIIAVDKGRVVAVLRYYPRKMIIADVEFDVLGLTDYCVDKSCIEDPTFGVNFYIKCGEMLRQGKYPFALGSARKIMSNYYYRFGHISCDSYCKCTIEKLKLPPSASIQDVEFEEVFNEENIGRYESLRRESFSSEWGLVIRTDNSWQWIGYQITHLKKYRFFEITKDSKLIGYFIIQGDNCIDYGLLASQYETYARAMISFISNNIVEDHLGLHFSPSNRLFQTLGLSNVAYTMRYVPDEGIIALGLNKKKSVDIFCRVVANARTKLKLEDKDFVLGSELSFRCRNKQVVPAFDPQEMKRKDEQILLNSLFLGTYGPFSLLNYGGPPILPPTFFRINDLDVM